MLTVRSLLKAAPIRSGRDVVARAGFRVLWMAIGGAIATVAGFLLGLHPTAEAVAFAAAGSVLVVLAGILLDAYRLPS